MGVLRYLKCAGDHASMSTPRFHYLDSAERVTPYPHLVRRLLLLRISESFELSSFRCLSAHTSLLDTVAWAIAARSNTLV